MDNAIDPILAQAVGGLVFDEEVFVGHLLEDIIELRTREGETILICESLMQVLGGHMLVDDENI